MQFHRARYVSATHSSLSSRLERMSSEIFRHSRPYFSSVQAPFFTYTDAAGVRRVVWFEDARSVRARLELVNEYGLAGISCWTVNRLYRPGLELLQGMFDAEKVI